MVCKLQVNKTVKNIFSNALAGVSHLVGVLSHELKDCSCDSQSGHIPRLWVLSQLLVKSCTRGNWWMFLSRISVSLPLSPHPFPLSKINK